MVCGEACRSARRYAAYCASAAFSAAAAVLVGMWRRWYQTGSAPNKLSRPVSMSLSVAARLALVLASVVLGCRPDPSTPRGTAERFLDAHFVHIDLPAALEFTAGLARHKVEDEIRLVAGQAIDETTRKPSVHYRLLGGLAMLIAGRGDTLLAAVGRGLGRRIEAERVTLGVLGGLAVVLRGVHIADDPAFATTAPFLVAERFDMRVELLPLLRRRLVVDRITIDAPIVNLIRDATGHLNVDSLGTRGEPTHAADASEAKSAGPPLQLLALRLRNGTIRYREGSAGRTLVLDDIAVDAREPHFGGPVPVSLRARLATTDLHLENILSEGVLDLAGERPAYRGTIAVGPGVLGPLPFERLSGEIAASPP